MMILEASKFLINLPAESSNQSHGTFMNMPIFSRQQRFRNGSHNKVLKCMQAKILHKKKALKYFTTHKYNQTCLVKLVHDQFLLEMIDFIDYWE